MPTNAEAPLSNPIVRTEAGDPDREPPAATPSRRTTVVSSMPTPRDSERRRVLLLVAVGAIVLALVATALVIRGDHLNPRVLTGGEGRAAAPALRPTDDARSDAPLGPSVTTPAAEAAGPSSGDVIEPGVGDADRPDGAAPSEPVESGETVQAVDDAVTTESGVAVVDVTANDRFDTAAPDGWVVTRVVDEDPHGVVTIDGAEVRYEADVTFTGVDEFDYEACQGDRCARASVTVDVTAAPRSTRFVARPTPLTAGGAPVDAGEAVTIAVDAQGLDATPTAALLRISVTDPVRNGEIKVASTKRSDRPTAYLDVDAGSGHTTQLVRVPVDASGQLTVVVDSGGTLTIQQVGVYLPSTRSSDGRFISVGEVPIGALDTATDGRVLRVRPSDHPEIPERGVGLALVRVEANVGADGGQIIVGAATYTDAEQQMIWPGWGESRNTVTEMIVTLGSEGTFELEYLGGSDITVTALGYFTNEDAPVSSAGLFVPIDPARRFAQPGRLPVSPVEHGRHVVGYHLN